MSAPKYRVDSEGNLVEDLRGILLAVAAAYALVAAFVVLYLRRLLYRRVESDPFG